MNHTNGGWARKCSAAISFAVVGALLATGCSSDPKDPMTSPPATVSPPSATAVETVVPPPTTPAVYKPATDHGPAENVPVPVLPEKAKEFSKEGLIAFTEYWYSTLGYAFETGDTKPMMEYSDNDCRMCAAMQEATVTGHEGGKWISGGKMILTPPSTKFVARADGTFEVVMMVRQEQVKYFNADKSLSEDLGVTTAEGDVLVGSYAQGRWTAVTVQHLAGSKEK